MLAELAQEEGTAVLCAERTCRTSCTEEPVALASPWLREQDRSRHLSTKKYVVQPARSSAPTSTV